ncbi:MAG: hypothetical protein ABR591_06240 [Candidatus Velthaea sp.]
MVPRIAALLARARAAGVVVVYSANVAGGITSPMSQAPFLPAVAPAARDAIVLGAGQTASLQRRSTRYCARAA